MPGRSTSSHVAPDDRELEKLVRLPQDDELRHAAICRAFLARNTLAMRHVPEERLIIPSVAKEAGRALAIRPADAIVERRDVMETYALPLAIERRGVDRFPDIGAEFRRIGDDATADTFDRMTEDERRHVKYCEAIGRRYARDDAEWQATVAKYRDVESRAFRHVARATLAYGMRTGLAWRAWWGRPGGPRCG